MSDLKNKHCKPCEGGVCPLPVTETRTLLGEVPGWQADDESKAIARGFSFRNYYETTAFVNAVAWIAHTEDHHPDIRFGYKSCEVRYSTHAIGGLSENDFICAARINAVVDD